jgi:protein-disulfide isomerase
MEKLVKKIIIGFLITALAMAAMFFVLWIVNILKPVQPASKLNYVSDKIYNFEISPADHILGDSNAPVTVVIFSDLGCPYSAKYYQVYSQLLSAKQYKDKVKIVWRHLPLNLAGFDSRPVSLAAECAGEQRQFWPFVNEIFTHQTNLNQPTFFEDLAKQLTLNLDQFHLCLNNSNYPDIIEAQYQEGLAKAIAGTPTSFINGKKIEGVLSLKQLKDLINQSSSIKN